ncbi:MAG: succinate dehydrogenase, hydrophobic membrane anchor protein [Gammaproteobacteria bacterium]|nr:MAG: succinate dehydrogenase, hydrophobic membrane anchor protein [Gammaproteobacteria bacterium]
MSRQASGMQAWFLQRITGAYIALFVLYLAGVFLFAAPADYAAWSGWVASPWVTVTGMLFFMAVLLHAWVGVRDILLDYVKHAGLRVGALTGVALVLLGSGIWAAKILLLTVHS